MKLVNCWNVKRVYKAIKSNRRRTVVDMECRKCKGPRTVRYDHLSVTTCLHCDGIIEGAPSLYPPSEAKGAVK